MANPALDRYNAACWATTEALHNSPAVCAAWDALPLHTRLRVILTVPWRDALGEIAATWRQRSERVAP